MPIVGTPVTSGSLPQFLSQRTYSIPELYGEAVLNRKPAYRIVQGTKSSLLVPIRTDSGDLIEIPDTVEFKYKIAEAIHKTVARSEGNILTYDLDRNEAVVPIDTNIADSPGIYVLYVGIIDNEQNIIFSKEYFIYNEPSAWGTSSQCALPSIDEVKLNLRDSDIVENELLGHYQFGVEEICFAALRVVEFWNSLPPVTKMPTTAFPYGNILRTGINVFLFEILLEWFRKNRLTYNAGGVAVDDLNKLNEYSAALQMALQQFQSLAQRTKASENIRAGYMRLG